MLLYDTIPYCLLYYLGAWQPLSAAGGQSNLVGPSQGTASHHVGPLRDEHELHGSGGKPIKRSATGMKRNPFQSVFKFTPYTLCGSFQSHYRASVSQTFA